MNRQLATIDLIEGTVNKMSKAGKPYSASILHYTVNGERKEKMILAKPMRDKLTQNFSSGETVVLSWEKNDQGYLDLVGIDHDDGSNVAASVPTSAPSTGRSMPANNDREHGMQVGNALTNAATLMAAGKVGDLSTLEEVAVMVLETGERLKARLAAGEFK